MDDNMSIGPAIEDSILKSVKKLLGYPVEETEFDTDILLNINSAIGTLTQLGVGPRNGYVVMGPDETYGDFLGENAERFPQVQMFLYMKTKLGFDSSTMSSSTIAMFQESIKELEFRLQVTGSMISREKEVS